MQFKTSTYDIQKASISFWITLTPVIASIEGIVVSAGLDEKIISGSAKWNERYGNKVEILDRNGRRLVNAYLRKVLVQIGQKIEQSQIIGLSGCPGGSRIPHLHFEVRKFDISHSGEENTLKFIRNINIL